jgi:hypothetical protein
MSLLLFAGVVCWALFMPRRKHPPVPNEDAWFILSQL